MSQKEVRVESHVRPRKCKIEECRIDCRLEYSVSSSNVAACAPGNSSSLAPDFPRCFVPLQYFRSGREESCVLVVYDED